MVEHVQSLRHRVTFPCQFHVEELGRTVGPVDHEDRARGDGGRRLGVECLNYKTGMTTGVLNAADVVVVMNESCGRELRDKFKVVKPMALW